MNKNKNITLIFPPLYLYTKVYPSIHYLKSYLNSIGYKNISSINQTQDFFEYLLKKPNFEKLLKASTSQNFMEFFVKQFKKLDEQESLNGEEAKKYLKLSKVIFESEYIYFFKRNYNEYETKEESPFFRYMVMFLKKQLSSHANTDIDGKAISVFFKNFFNSFTIPQIIEDSPVFIGISIIDSLQLIPTYILLGILRDNGFSGRIFLGGPFFSKRYEYVIKSFSNDTFLKDLFSKIDGIILFEGEIILDKVMNSLDSSFSHIPNLLLQKDKIVYLTGLLNKDTEFFKKLPPPNFDNIDFRKAYEEIPYLVSRGCYWRKCSFCKSHSIYQNKFVSRTSNIVIKDILHLQSKYKSSTFYFCDEAIPLQSISEVCDSMLDNNIKWSGNARFEKLLLDADFCKKLYAGGCRKLMFGLESGSQRVLDIMSKGIKICEAEKILKNLHISGIKTHIYVIFGFPGETDIEAEETIRFVEKNIDFIDSAHPHTFILEKGTPIHEQYKYFGIVEIKEKTVGLASGNECTFAEKTTRKYPNTFYSSRLFKMFNDKDINKEEINCEVTLNFNLEKIRKALANNIAEQGVKKETKTYIYNPSQEPEK